MCCNITRYHARENVKSLCKIPSNHTVSRKNSRVFVTFMTSLRHFSTIVIREDKGFVCHITVRDGWLGKTWNIPSIAKIGLLSTTVQSTKEMQYARTPDTVRNFMTDLINEGFSLVLYVRRIYPRMLCDPPLLRPKYYWISRTRGGLDFRPESQGILCQLTPNIFFRPWKWMSIAETTGDNDRSRASGVKCVRVRRNAQFRGS